MQRSWSGMLCACLVLGYSATVASQEKSNPDAETVKLAAADFVEAFENLEWDRFEASWAPDATVFFPFTDEPQRVDGRSAIMERFRSAFESLPERMDGPPYLSIQPMDLHVQMLGDSAVVTFHLVGSGPFNRRTIVFVNSDNKWLIAHLHASRVSVSPE
jgi:ketosteroid isomerase-like protein